MYRETFKGQPLVDKALYSIQIKEICFLVDLIKGGLSYDQPLYRDTCLNGIISKFWCDTYI